MNATVKIDLDEAGYPVHRASGVRCGNHGRGDKVYHADVATVKACYAIRAEETAQQNAEIEAERAYERKLEDAGSAEAYAEAQWEASRGVVDFSTAFAESRRDLDYSDVELDGARMADLHGTWVDPEECAGAEPATERRNNDWNAWSSADRERAQYPTRRPAKITQDGMYRNPETDEIWKVQVAVHGSGQLYAKKLIKLDTPKIKRSKEYSHDFQYIPGGIKTLRPEWRMSLAEAQEFGRLYGCCIRCGAVLTAEESIERAMGPICAGKGNWA